MTEKGQTEHVTEKGQTDLGDIIKSTNQWPGESEFLEKNKSLKRAWQTTETGRFKHGVLIFESWGSQPLSKGSHGVPSIVSGTEISEQVANKIAYFHESWRLENRN